jgi:uncharacterized protein (TIGR02145 family)
MKITYFNFIILLLIFSNVFSQGVVINENNPNPVLDSSALFELQSTAKGFLLPRLTTEQRQNIQNPAIGLTIYNLSIHCLEFFNGTDWIPLCGNQQTEFQCGDMLNYSGHNYKTVQLGAQCWFAENLRTEKYNDDSDIIYDTGSWVNATTGRYAWFENNSSNGLIYGALYNNFAVATGKLCPAGWNVASESDWVSLINYMGGNNASSILNLKAQPPDWHGNDTEGFTALPGRWRYAGGTFYNFNLIGKWYTSTTNPQGGVYVLFGNLTTSVATFAGETNSGCSVRCIKN